MGRYLLTNPAKQDLRDIIGYIRKGSPSAAVRVRREFQDTMRRLADFPHMGHVRTDLALESLRVWSLYYYLIIYRPERKPLAILRILHGARDIEAFMGRSLVTSG